MPSSLFCEQVWFQNRRAKLRRLRGQPTAVFPPPMAVCPSLHQCPPATSLKVPQPSTSSPSVYLHHQQQLQQQTVPYQSIGVQTQKFPLIELSPSPSPIHFRVHERRSLSSTPSVSPLSTPSGSPSALKIVSPPQNGAVYPPACGIVFPTRTSPPPSAVHLPVSTSQLSLGQGVSFNSPFPCYCPPHTSSAVPSAPMYFLDMTPPLSGSRVSSVIPPFPQFYQI